MLRKPTYSITELAFGPLHSKAMLSPRVAPAVIGLGLLEAIAEPAIRANADPDDANHDGISGRTNEVWSMAHQHVALGRFGWKAGMPTIHDQSASAAAGDIGLSSSLVPKPAGDCTPAETKCMNAPNGNSERSGGYEIGDDLYGARHVLFAEPRGAGAAQAHGPRGPAAARPCSDRRAAPPAICRRSRPAPSTDQPQLSNQRIWPYTDLLLHDMGEGLADNRPEGEADGQEWRTAPLWGHRANRRC